KSAQALGGPKRFVLGASGHIAGSINPASKNKRSFWVNENSTASTPQQWLDGATEVSGSWWNDWAKWLANHRGELVDAPRQCGAARFKPIESAPGSYVRVRAI
ncbi:MAG: class I poly(R)-hydroxyalkanoic acid synthase, partial [Burkholderiaceae bacterium]